MSRWSSIRSESAIFENSSVLALNKPTGISVVGERFESDLVRLAAESGERLFPVHRIDKVTSGVILLAKDLATHSDLTRQFSQRSVAKTYLAITRSEGLPESGTIELPLSVGRKGRPRIAANRASIKHDSAQRLWSVPTSEVFAHTRTYPSVTSYARIWQDERNAVLVVRPVTGRRHQIRVHLAWIGHPIEGDPLFEGKSAPTNGRTCLHSWQLAFNPPWEESSSCKLQAPPGVDFWLPVVDRLPDGDVQTLLNMASEAASGLDA